MVKIILNILIVEDDVENNDCIDDDGAAYDYIHYTDDSLNDTDDNDDDDNDDDDDDDNDDDNDDADDDLNWYDDCIET